MRCLRASSFASDYQDSEGRPVIPDNPVPAISEAALEPDERRTCYLRLTSCPVVASRPNLENKPMPEPRGVETICSFSYYRTARTEGACAGRTST
jgi:hypothetical protein